MPNSKDHQSIPDPTSVTDRNDAGRNESDRNDTARNASAASINAFSRVLAVMLLMVVPGVIGYFLDKWLGTHFLVGIGFVVGMIGTIFGLILVAKRADDEMKRGT